MSPCLLHHAANHRHFVPEHRLDRKNVCRASSNLERECHLPGDPEVRQGAAVASGLCRLVLDTEGASQCEQRDWGAHPGHRQEGGVSEGTAQPMCSEPQTHPNLDPDPDPKLRTQTSDQVEDEVRFPVRPIPPNRKTRKP